MDKVQEILGRIALPLTLPEEAYSFAQGQPNLDLIISQLPLELYPYLDLEVTGSHRSQDGQIVYRLQLMDGGYIKVRVQNCAIVELTKKSIMVEGAG
ncbi:MAG: hypothetical protein AB1489_03605 [Acidobacteriota bacterium]